MMSNWCFNDLLVQGKKHDLEQFKKLVKTEDEPLAFEQTVPLPIIDPDEEDIFDWDEWYSANWGTDPIVQDMELKRKRGSLRYNFYTRWTPPRRWLCQIARQFPALRFRLFYDEVGCLGKGRDVYANGIYLVYRSFHKDVRKITAEEYVEERNSLRKQLGMKPLYKTKKEFKEWIMWFRDFAWWIVILQKGDRFIVIPGEEIQIVPEVGGK
jgi:Ferredoxin-like domain in Api92-like protein